MKRRILALALLASIVTRGHDARACDTCTNPGGGANPPTAACQYRGGRTDASWSSEVWTVDLVAGESYVFTFCPSTCASVRGSWNTLLRLYSPSCALLSEADDGCGAAQNVIFGGEASTSREHVEEDVTARLQFFDLRVADRCETLSLREFPSGL